MKGKFEQMNRMRKYLWMLGAMLISATMTMLTSCSDNDDPVVPSKVETLEDMKALLVGTHLDLSDYLMGEEEIRVWDLYDDGTLTAYDLRFEEDDEFCIDTLKGDWKPFLNKEFQVSETEVEKMSGFTATIKSDFEDSGAELLSADLFGFIFDDNNGEMGIDFFLDEYSYYDLMMLDFDSPAATRAAEMGNSSENVISNMSKLLKDGVTKSDIANKENAKQLLKSTLSKLAGKPDGEVYFNPNDSSFTQDLWREQANIYIYDGVGPESAGGYKFSIVPLPWSNNVTNTNLPFGFCNDMTPKTGWQLVLNYCGSTVSTNTNYFALYNKYTGILRFFFYMPQQFNANNANDHAWKVVLTNDLLQHVNMRYSLPMSKKIVDKAAIGMNDADASILVTPWSSQKSSDNYITPKMGWWAFDVDLSLYRPNFHAVNQQLRLQLCGWQKDAVTLSSTIDAKIKEQVAATTYSFNSLGEMSSIVLDAKGPVMGLYTNITGGNWWEAVKSGFSLAKWGFNVATSVNDRNNEPSYMVKQYIDGTISTQGLISGSRPITGISEPTIPMNNFDVKNTTLGQGVWNLKGSPIVYQADADIIYGYGDYVGTVNDWKPEFSFFPDQKNYNHGFYCFFDPSSVEVVLNPNAIPADQVEYMDVQSFCGVRKGTTHNTNADYRRAFGLQMNEALPLSSNPLIRMPTKENPIPNDNPLYDYLYDSQDKMGYSYPSTVDTYETQANMRYSLLGRGDADYLLEPVIFVRSDETNDRGKFLPCYEVTVTLTVKLKGLAKPLVFTRTYLPEYELLRLSNAKTLVKRFENYIDKVKKNGKPSKAKATKLLDMQLNHLKSAFQFLKPSYMSDMEGVTFKPQGWKEMYTETTTKYLFDGNIKTDWESHIGARENGQQWEIQFSTNRFIKIKHYTITTTSKWYEYTTSNPSHWKLYAHLRSPYQHWVLIDERYAPGFPDDALPKAASASKTYEIKDPVFSCDYELDIVNYDGSLNGFYGSWNQGGCTVRIAELSFTDY